MTGPNDEEIPTARNSEYATEMAVWLGGVLAPLAVVWNTAFFVTPSVLTPSEYISRSLLEAVACGSLAALVIIGSSKLCAAANRKSVLRGLGDWLPILIIPFWIFIAMATFRDLLNRWGMQYDFDQDPAWNQWTRILTLPSILLLEQYLMLYATLRRWSAKTIARLRLSHSIWRKFAATFLLMLLTIFSYVALLAGFDAALGTFRSAFESRFTRLSTEIEVSKTDVKVSLHFKGFAFPTACIFVADAQDKRLSASDFDGARFFIHGDGSLDRATSSSGDDLHCSTDLLSKANWADTEYDEEITVPYAEGNNPFLFCVFVTYHEPPFSLGHNLYKLVVYGVAPCAKSKIIALPKQRSGTT